MDKLTNHKSLAEHIVEDLEQKIFAGKLKPGQRIIEDPICEAFGVSRSPVREAFQILASRGLVVREPRKGISVATIKRQEAENYYRIRYVLEGLAVSLAVQRQTPELVKKLKMFHAKMIEVSVTGNHSAYRKLNQQFHELIMNDCGNPQLIQMIYTLRRHMTLLRMAVTNSPGWMESSTKIHEALIAAIEAGDAEAAEQIRKNTIIGLIERFSEIFENE
jgi:DNA-binding GntR family transcriptional regulator